MVKELSVPDYKLFAPPMRPLRPGLLAQSQASGPAMSGPSSPHACVALKH